MDTLLLGILVLVVSVAVLVGTVVFVGWAAAYFGCWAYRQATRSHLYVPVTAKVTRTLFHGWNDIATLYAEYEHGGEKIVNRFSTSRAVARLAQGLKRIDLRIDPDHPKDVEVDPSFSEQAGAADALDGRTVLPLGATSLRESALRLLPCMLLAGVLAVGAGSLRRGVDDHLLLGLSFGISLAVYSVCLLVAWSRLHKGGEGRHGFAGEKK